METWHTSTSMNLCPEISPSRNAHTLRRPLRRLCLHNQFPPGKVATHQHPQKWAQEFRPAEMHTPSGDTRAALASTPNPTEWKLGVYARAAQVSPECVCVHFGWTKVLGTLLWMLMCRHFPGRNLGNYAETAKCSPEGVCISAGRNFWAQVHRC